MNKYPTLHGKYCVSRLNFDSVISEPTPQIKWWINFFKSNVLNPVILFCNQAYSSQNRGNIELEDKVCVECQNTIDEVKIFSFDLVDEIVNLVIFHDGIYHLQIHTNFCKHLNITLFNFPVAFKIKLFLTIYNQEDIDIFFNNTEFIDSMLDLHISIFSQKNTTFNCRMFGSKMNNLYLLHSSNGGILSHNYLIENNQNLFIKEQINILQNNTVINSRALIIGEKGENLIFHSEITNTDVPITIHQNITCFSEGNNTIIPYVNLTHNESFLYHQIYSGSLGKILKYYFLLKGITEQKIYKILYNTFLIQHFYEL